MNATNWHWAQGRGLFAKFRVERLTPSSKGIDHSDCRYFVLDLTHDPHALPAALVYANSCESELPLLARDLRVRVAKSIPVDLVPSDQDQDPSKAATHAWDDVNENHD
jgi:hypothetical protein